MKKIVILMLACTLWVWAGFYEYPTLYKDPKAMARGGTGVSGELGSASIFYNPAGLMMEERMGLPKIDVFQASIVASGESQAFYDAFADANFSTLAQTYGDTNYHLAVNNYSALYYRGKTWGYSVGWLSQKLVNTQLDTLVDKYLINTLTAYTLTANVGYAVSEALYIGYGLKYTQGNAGVSAMTPTDSASFSGSTLPSYLTSIASEFNAMSHDLGMVYHVQAKEGFWHTVQPTVSVSMLNLGGHTLGEYATIPTTLNAGVALRLFERIDFEADYIDMGNALSSDYDSSFFKHIRFGGTVRALDNAWIVLDVSTGIYMGAVSFGFSMQMPYTTLTYANYVEEMGLYSYDNPDRRHHLSFAYTW